MKNCELCGKTARMHCESDKASLCWECDENVHTANFLVAKHVRYLLCHVCQSPTPWRASGRKLGPTVSVCESCVENNCNENRRQVLCRRMREESRGGADNNVGEYDDVDVEEDEDEESDYDDDDLEEEDEDEDEEDEDGENQVVPWSCDSPPPVASSSSSGEEEPTSRYGADLDRHLGIKRLRESGDLASFPEDDFECASSRLISRAVPEDGVDASASVTEPPLKLRRADVTETDQSTAKNEAKYGRLKTDSNPSVVIHALNGLQNSVVTENNAAATISGIWKLSRYQSG